MHGNPLREGTMGIGAGIDVERSAADWLARCDRGCADPGALEAWLEADTAHRVAFLRLRAAWDEAGRLQALGAGLRGDGPPPRGHWNAPPETRREQMLQALAARKQHPVRRRRRRGLRAAAAVVVFCMLAGGLGWRAWSHVDTAAYHAVLGETLVQLLTDGSQATLASGSAIEVALSHRQRRVELLRGEAIFAVAKDPDRPFVVVAGRHDVVAVGTRFSVRRDADALRVVVTEGVVRLEAAQGGSGPSALLPAGSVATVGDDGVMVRSMSPVDADHLLEWRDGLLSFRDTPLADAAAEFNRYNARKLVVGDAGAGALRIGGNFRWDNLDGFVRLLEAGFPVRAETDGDRIVLRSR